MVTLQPDNPRQGPSVPGRNAPPRPVGIHDREFTLFQVSGLVSTALERGQLPSALGQSLKLDPHPVTGHTARPHPAAQNWPATQVSYVEMRRILEEFWFSTDRTQSIFDHAARLTFASFGVVGLASMAFPSRREGIRFCTANFRTAWEARPEDNPDGSITLYHLPKFYDPEMRPGLELLHFVNCFSVFRSHTPGVPVAQRVGLTRSAGIPRTALEQFFGCPVQVGADVAHVHFTQEFLHPPGHLITPDVQKHLLALCRDNLTEGETQGQTPLQFLSDHIREIHSADDMARLLGVSRRTLIRLLERDGVSYSLLAREARLHHARRMLRGGTPVADIAEVLGFSDERSFRRAFLAWSGTTPAAYRAQPGNH